MENGRALSHVPEENDAEAANSATATAASLSALDMSSSSSVAKSSNHKPFFRRLSFKGLRRGKVSAPLRGDASVGCVQNAIRFLCTLFGVKRALLICFPSCLLLTHSLTQSTQIV